MKTTHAIFAASVFTVGLFATHAAHSQLTSGTGAGAFRLEIDGQSAGFLASAQGGNVLSDVVVEKLGPGQTARRDLAGVKYEDITLKAGASMSPGFNAWLNVTGAASPRKDGTIVTLNASGAEVSRLTFSRAFVTEVAFPELDVSSTDPFVFTVKLSPEMTRMVTASNGGPQTSPSPRPSSKRALTSGFRVHIDGIPDADAATVTRARPLIFKRQVPSDAAGHAAQSSQGPLVAVVPFSIELAEAHAGAFYTWHEAAVIRGSNDARTGSIDLLAANQERVLTLSLSGLHIVRVTPITQESHHESIRRITVEMTASGFQLDSAAAP